MNKNLENIDIEKVIFMDAEMVSTHKDLDPNSKEFELYQYKQRNRETGELPEEKDVLAHYKQFAGLHPAYNKIVCISIGMVQGTKLHLKSIVGTQKEILEQFFTIINTQDYYLVHYSGLNYDIPMIRLKSYEEDTDIKMNYRYSDSGKKPWEMDANIDLYSVIRGTGSGSMTLAEVCHLFGIDTPKDDISGADVSRVFWEDNNIKRIAKYCNKDVKALVDLFIFLQGNRITISEVIEREDEPKPEYKKLMETIELQKSIKPAQQKKLLTLCKGMDDEQLEIAVQLLIVATGREEDKFYDEIRGVNLK